MENIELSKLPAAISMLQEMGIIGSSEEDLLTDAWKKLTKADKAFMTGIVKGLVIGLSERESK